MIESLQKKVSEEKQLFKEVSSLNEEDVKGYESKICSLQKTIRSLNQSTQQKLTEKDQVMHTHLQTDSNIHTDSYHHLRHEPHYYIHNTHTMIVDWKPHRRDLVQGSKD